MNNFLPINKNERPLFSCRKILESCMREFHRTNEVGVYEAVSKLDIYEYAAKMNVLVEILKLRPNLREHSTDLFDQIKKLPLFYHLFMS